MFHIRLRSQVLFVASSVSSNSTSAVNLCFLNPSTLSYFFASHLARTNLRCRVSWLLTTRAIPTRGPTEQARRSRLCRAFHCCITLSKVCDLLPLKSPFPSRQATTSPRWPSPGAFDRSTDIIRYELQAGLRQGSKDAHSLTPVFGVRGLIWGVRQSVEILCASSVKLSFPLTVKAWAA